jgi:ABC-type molybdate transport system substrate-binding protein
MVDQLLQPGLRIHTSRPVADPSGDYAMAMFERMDRAHPGAGAKLRANAMRQMDLSPPATGQNATAALFAAGSIDVAVTYCSAVAATLDGAPDLVSVPVPDAFDPGPIFGLALLSDKPDAARHCP